MLKALLFSLLLTLASSTPCRRTNTPTPQKATSYLQPDPSASTKINGTVDITQTKTGLHLKLYIQGLSPGEHGFHVHAFGSIFPNCTAAGDHFNPDNTTHGAPTDSVRHAGDLGNIVANEFGVVDTEIVDSVIALDGRYNIIGRSFVVHANRDDLGRGNAPTSKTNGNSGARVACGVIGIAKS
ncbi:uncharacterized protein SPPG_00453 [Spizellomyces punctatus DAOM BR117]|uniref:Superoxide dismutase [Cu-Zn] n=1 Tax=Spizellomyces punctatus (strain DAOM BR117) TaxID=645134 RepID=A0A0L0HUG3_SPIPD|nr:uncharacterized protein SPPG_00453 [Spizellomyces punctatus DAOM BR117]KND04748.1 hypothetical protein SPPG_00453 [Spizellomyces punctatus DAOM BR117]|eukprot:XP_016612787.1 hypothetical protein SPPG_00453 [Spizellomyces punctatus DAOM BR117]